MTIEDLREHGVLLPEEEWGRHELETTVPEWPLLAAFLAAGVLWVLAYLGDGGLATGLAVTGFLVILYAITWICDRAITRQREKFARERERLERSGETSPRGEGPSAADRADDERTDPSGAGPAGD